MAGSHSRNASSLLGGDGDEGVLSSALNTRQIEAFGKKVSATASHLMGDTTSNNHYPNAINQLSRQMQRPGLQQSVFSLAQTSPRDLVRSKLSTSEISHRALTHLSNELLENIPENASTYSLFQGFQATLPEGESQHRKSHRRRSSKTQKLLPGASSNPEEPPSLETLKKDRNAMDRRLGMMGVRKNLCSTEILEIDTKISNLTHIRKIVLDRLADLENDEAQAEHELMELDSKIETVQEELEDAQALHESASTIHAGGINDDAFEPQAMDDSFMSESIYEKLPPISPKKRRPKPNRRKSMPVLHEHLEPGSNTKTLPAHHDVVTALDFDMPFGTMVTAALDDTARVWDLNLGRCIGFLEGHTASVRCLQVEDNVVATGSMDASIRLWDLSRAKYEPYENAREGDEEDDGLGFANPDEDAPPPPPSNSLEECPLFVLEAHVDAVTALHMRGDTLVSGSADKTLRQWDLAKGRCVQTLDVLWTAAQASATLNAIGDTPWKPTTNITAAKTATMTVGRSYNANADFVGALQCFDAALACGTADGMVRLWDLRSGQVHRSLVGHTGPVTCLQFDDTHLVTGSTDRSIRIWDLRTGTIHDAYAYDHPVTSMSFDSRRIVSAAGEAVAKIYDKTDGRHWDCGAGADAADAADAAAAAAAAAMSGQDGYPAREQATAAGTAGIVERVKVKDGYLIEGRRDGVVGVWTC